MKLQTINHIEYLNERIMHDSTNPINFYNIGAFYQYSSVCDDIQIPSVDCSQLALDNYLHAKRIIEETSSWKRLVNYEGMLNDIGVLFIAQGRLNDAKSIFETVIASSPHQVNALGNLALVCDNLGETENAERYYERALQNDPNNSRIIYNYGLHQYRLKRSKESWHLWERATALDPSLSEAFSNLATLYCSENLSLSIDYYNKGIQALLLRNITDSRLWTLRFLAASTAFPVIILSYDQILTFRRRFDTNLINLFQSWTDNLSVNPKDLNGCSSLGYNAIYHGYEDYYIRSLYACGIWKLSRRMLSTVHRYNEFRRINGGLKSLTANPSISLVNHAETSTFITDSVGITANTLISKIGRSTSSMSPSNRDHTECRMRNSSLIRKIRVGFISAFWYRHSVGLLLQGVIHHIDRSLFDVTVLRIITDESFNINDNVTDFIKSSNSVYIELTGSLNVIQNQIINLYLDVLVFGEIGMDPTTYLLAFGHLAERSVVFWGHAVTSGINSKVFEKMNGYFDWNDESFFEGPDYFISSTLFEPQLEFAQSEYSERLILLDSLTTYFYIPPLPLHRDEICKIGFCSDTPINQSCLHKNPKNYVNGWLFPCSFEFLQYMINSDRSLAVDETEAINRYLSHVSASLHLYAIPQTLYKLNPDFDDILAQIFELDKDALIVLPRGNDVTNKNIILKRWIDRGILSSNSSSVKVLFLRPMSEREFLTFSAVADVVLDPWPVGGGRSSLEIFSTSTPIVVYHNKNSTTSIIQLTIAMYRVMGNGLDRSSICCVADNKRSYVTIAVNIAKNHSLQSYIRSIISETSSRLYQNFTVIEEWNQLIRYIATAQKPIPKPISYQEIVECFDDNSNLLKNKSFCDVDKRMYDSIVSNSLWIPSELKSTVFSYFHPALVLRNIINVNTSTTNCDDDNQRVPLILYSQLFTVKNHEIQLTVYDNEDWIETCLNHLKPYYDHIFLEGLFACSIIGRGVQRLTWPTYFSVYISYNAQKFAYEIKEGDDIQQISDDLVGSPSWVAKRRSIGSEFALRYLEDRQMIVSPHAILNNIDLKRDRRIHSDRSSSYQTITLGVTTSRRLSVFIDTMNAMTSTFGPLPNQLITDVVVIDDASSSSDRKQMLTLFPNFTFIFKSANDRGHANSLNKLLKFTKTKYLLYLEDDWKLSNIIGSSEIIYSLHLCADDVIGSYRLDSMAQGYCMIIYALSILGHQGNINLPKDIFKNGERVVQISDIIVQGYDRCEKVHQVLFNEQSSRACAEGTMDCFESSLGSGGWRRIIKTKINIIFAATGFKFVDVEFPYSLHEFGYIQNMKGFASRNHGFSHWPGFSLNPGLWNLEAIKEINCRGWDDNFFNENRPNVSFEQIFSACIYASGFNMAYLGLKAFTHNDGPSAYDINGIKRKWQHHDALTTSQE